MTELIYKIFGIYAMQVIIQVNQLFEIYICTLLFCWYFERRKLFAVRIIASFVVSLLIAVLLAVISTHAPSIWTNFLSAAATSGIAIGFLFFCFKEDRAELLLCWCGGISAFQATGALVTVFYAACGIDSRYTISFWNYAGDWDWPIYYLIHIALYVALSLVFSRKKLRGTAESMKNTVLLSVFTVVFMIIMSSIGRMYEPEALSALVVTKLVFATLYIIILILRTGIFTQSKYKQDLKIMDELMREEKKQFERVKSNIDVINMKCHDLKHHLTDLEGKISEAELAALKSAIEIYDTSLKTGNDILDVVVYEKSLVCERENIKLDCMADGKALSFMSPSHVYSLFGNAVDNAIEAVSALDPELRTIGVTVGHMLGLVEITVVNRFAGERKITDDSVETQKADKARHGYGIKSIKYIASLYNGQANISAENGIFTLHVLLPPPPRE